MLEEQAEVTDVDGRHAWVACRAQVDCPRCAAGNGCGGGVLGKWLGDRLKRVRVVHDGDVRVGDCVVIGLDERVLVQMALLVYGVPLALMLLAAAAAQAAFGTDAATAMGMAAGLAVGFAWVAAFSRKIRLHRRFQPRVVRRAVSAEQA